MAPAGDNFVSMKALYDAADCSCRLCRSDKAGKGKRRAEMAQRARAERKKRGGSHDIVSWSCGGYAERRFSQGFFNSCNSKQH